MNTKLYVGNLAATTTERELQDLCSPYGNVAAVNLSVERDCGRRWGFAIVTMATPQGARAAILALNGKEVRARVMTVAEYVFAKKALPANGPKGKVATSAAGQNGPDLRRLFGIV